MNIAIKEHHPASESAIIHIDGLDAKKLLQGQLTINLDCLPAKTFKLAAQCNPQGRVISLFDIAEHQGAYYLILPESMVSIAINALKKYAIFYKVTITPTLAIPFEYALPAKADRIRAGIPMIYPNTSGCFLPHELNLPSLQAVSFDKGCYTGQEIIARMEYRGKLKKHLHVATTTSASPIAPNDEAYIKTNNGKEFRATIVDSAVDKTDNHVILLICDDADAKNEHLYIGADNNPILFSRQP